jgi:ribonuclease BN (tRNA processing enzyme)
MKKYILTTVAFACLAVLASALSAIAAEPEKSLPDGFRVTIIGSGNPKLDIKRGGPSTLVQYKDKYFLVDCGQWATRGLLDAGIEVTTVKNMLFTHQHADHNSDYWAFAQGGWGLPTGRRQLNLVGPGVTELHRVTLEFFKTDLEYRTKVVGFPTDGLITNVNITEFTGPTESLEMDGVKITAIPVPHTITTYAYRFESGGHSVVVSGDLRYTDKFGPFAKGADILVIDGQLACDFSDLPPAAVPGIKAGLSKSHILNEDIGRVAVEANPKQLILTHLSGGLKLEANSALYSKAGFQGKVIEARDGLVLEP